MAFGRNIPQEQAMLKELPDELLESGLNAKPGDSPFTQILGAMEMSSRVKKRKSAKQTLDGLEGQDGTVVGRMIAKRNQIAPPANAPSFMTGGPVKGEIPPQFQPGYQAQGAAPSAPSAPPTRNSVTRQHQSSGGGGQNASQLQLAYNRSPQKLATGGVVQQSGGLADRVMDLPRQVEQGMLPDEMLSMQMRAGVDGQAVNRQRLAHGGEVQGYMTGGVTPITRAQREEERRLAYLRERGLPVGEMASQEENWPEVILPEAPLAGPQMPYDPSQTVFDPEEYARASASLGAPAGNRSQMTAEDQMQGYRNPLQRGMDALGLFNGVGDASTEPLPPRPLSDWGAQGPPGPGPVNHPAPGAPTPQGPEEYGTFELPTDDLGDMKERLMADKVALGLDTATAEAVGETDDQRSDRWARATALATMAASFGSEATFFEGLTKGTAGAAQVMQGHDQSSRDRADAVASMENKQLTAKEALRVRAEGLRNDHARGIVGTDVKMKQLAIDSVYKDIEQGIVQIPEDEAGMARLIQAKMSSIFGISPQQAQSDPSVGAAALATKE